MHLVAAHQFHAFKVAGAEVEIVVLSASIHEQGGLLDAQRVQRLAEYLAFGFAQLEILDHGELAIGILGRQRRAQRAQQLLARELVVIGAGLRTMHRAAVSPSRRADGTYAAASAAFLSPP